MTTGLIIIMSIILYAAGVGIAYFKIMDWNWSAITKREDYQTLFMFSLLSWVAFVLYAIVKLLNDEES